MNSIWGHLRSNCRRIRCVNLSFNVLCPFMCPTFDTKNHQERKSKTNRNSSLLGFLNGFHVIIQKVLSTNIPLCDKISHASQAHLERKRPCMAKHNNDNYCSHVRSLKSRSRVSSNNVVYVACSMLITEVLTQMGFPEILLLISIHFMLWLYLVYGIFIPSL